MKAERNKRYGSALNSVHEVIESLENNRLPEYSSHYQGTVTAQRTKKGKFYVVVI